MLTLLACFKAGIVLYQCSHLTLGAEEGSFPLCLYPEEQWRQGGIDLQVDS